MNVKAPSMLGLCLNYHVNVLKVWKFFVVIVAAMKINLTHVHY